MGSLPSASSTTSSQSQTRQRRRATRSSVAELLERTGMCAFCHYGPRGGGASSARRRQRSWGMLERSGMVATLLDSEAYARSQGASCHVLRAVLPAVWSLLHKEKKRRGVQVPRDCGQRWTGRIAPTRWETAMRVTAATGTPKEPPSPASLSSPDTMNRNGELIPFTPETSNREARLPSPTVPKVTPVTVDGRRLPSSRDGSGDSQGAWSCFSGRPKPPDRSQRDRCRLPYSHAMPNLHFAWAIC